MPWVLRVVELSFHPRPGTVLLCDYELSRSARIPHEMTKQRPVVVLSRRWRRQFDPVIVVPLSTSAPMRPDERHVRIAAGSYDFLRSDVDSWAKCEFVCAVGQQRLDWLRRRGAHISPRLGASDFRSIVRAAVCAVGGRGLLATP